MMFNPINHNNKNLTIKDKNLNKTLNAKFHAIAKVLLKPMKFVYANQITTAHQNVKSVMQKQIIKDLGLSHSNDINWKKYWSNHTMVMMPLSSDLYFLLFHDMLGFSPVSSYDLATFRDKKYGYFALLSNVLKNHYLVFDDFLSKTKPVSFKNRTIFRGAIVKNYQNLLHGYNSYNRLDSITDFYKALVKLQQTIITCQYQKAMIYFYHVPKYDADCLMHQLYLLITSNFGKQLYNNHYIFSFKAGLNKLSLTDFTVMPLTKKLIKKVNDRNAFQFTNSLSSYHFTIKRLNIEGGSLVTEYYPMTYELVNYLVYLYIKDISKLCNF